MRRKKNYENDIVMYYEKYLLYDKNECLIFIYKWYMGFWIDKL